jgi:CheY-like chemotaxis protein
MGRKILTDAGYEVVAVNNGSAALKKLAEQKPDIIVLDVYMPGYSGLEVCQRIKENRETARIPVLLTVGKLEPFKPEEARRARADAFVVKPFEASELLAALTKLEQKLAPEPEPYKPGRFAKAIASIDESTPAEKFGDVDEGWKSRLRFPGSKKKQPEKTEPEEAPDFVTASPQVRDFRDFEPPARTSAPPTLAAPTPQAPAKQFEPPMPAGLPRDITPEEIAAISAAAAQLTGASAAIFPPPPPPPFPAASETRGSDIVVEPASAAQSPVPSLPAVEAPAVETLPAPVVSTAVEEVAEAPKPAGDAAPDTSSQEEATPSPRQDSEPATLVGATATEPVPEVVSAPEAIEAHTGTAAREQPVAAAEAISSFVSVDASATAAVAEPEAPVVASTSPATPEPAELPVIVPGIPLVEDAAPFAVPAAIVEDAPRIEESSVLIEAAATTAMQPEPAVDSVISAANEPAVVATKPEQTAPQAEGVSEQEPVAAADSIPAEVVASVPPSVPEVISAPVNPAPAHHEEVMAALDTLIPVAAAATESQSAPVIFNEIVAPVGASYAASRWILEAVPLSVEESASSLEKEMELSFAASAASEAARMLATATVDSVGAQPPIIIATGEPVRFAGQASEPAAAAVAVTTEGAVIAADTSAAMSPEQLPASPEVAAASAPAASPEFGVTAVAAIAEVSEPAVMAMASAAGAESAGSTASHHPEPTVVPASDAPAVDSQPVVVQECAPVAAPDSRSVEAPSEVRLPEPGQASEPFSEPASEASTVLSSAALREVPVLVPSEISPDPNSAEVAESMDRKSDSNLGFKMIRQSPAGAKTAKGAPTKETFETPAAEAEPAAMAAAASADAQAPAPAASIAAPDPRAIANIVDSVLAELRPKIVEEIAKKLADTKKE